MIIRTVDTDVVVLAIGHFLVLRLDELCVSFGVGTHFRQIAIHEIVQNFNEKALMFFHAISGCDTIVQQPRRHVPLNLAKIPPNQVIADFGRESSVESESE